EFLLSAAAKPVKDWLADPQIPKRGYDLHRADLALYWQGITFAGADFDIELAAYLLDPTDNNQTISGLAAKYYLPQLAPDDGVDGKGAKFKAPDPETLSRHLARKALAMLRLMPLQKEELEKNEMNRLFYELEMPLSRILADMEKQGISVNRDALAELGKEF